MKPWPSERFWKSFYRRDEGAIVVEFALVIPVLVLLLIGAVDFGRLAVVGVAISSAAKAGAQYGAQSTATSVDTIGMRLAAEKDFNLSRLGTVSVNARWECRCPSNEAVTSCTVPTCTGADPTPRVYVQVQSTRSVALLLHYPGLPTTVSVVRRVVIRAQ